MQCLQRKATLWIPFMLSCVVSASQAMPLCDSQVYGAWSQWSECGQNCGADIVTRSRSCIQNCSVADCSQISMETKCCLSFSTCGTCSDNRTHVIATSANIDFTLVNKKNPPTGNISGVLFGSGITLNHSGNTIYEMSLSDGSYFELEEICIQTNARFVILGIEDVQTGRIEYIQRINNETSSACVCWQKTSSFVTRKVALKLLNGGRPIFAKDLFISACVQSCPPEPLVERPSCGISQVEDAGIPGGHKPQQNIFFGYDALPNEFPWQVGLYYNRDESECGGVIIDTLYILTAAHCLVGNVSEDGIVTPIEPYQVTVSTGDHDQLQLECGEMRYNVEKVILHEWYDDYRLLNDIALLKLVSPGITNWANAAPICMPKVASEQRKGDNVVLSGYGVSEFADFPVPLQYAVLPMMGFMECQYCIGVRLGVDLLNDGNLCAGTCKNETAGACLGDSGGPLVANEGDVWELVGIVSAGIDDCGASPDIMADVYYYRFWIKRNTPDAVQPLFPDVDPLVVEFF